MLLFGLDRYETVTVSVCKLNSVFGKIANVVENRKSMFDVYTKMLKCLGMYNCEKKPEAEKELVFVIGHDSACLYDVADYFEWVISASALSLATFFVVLNPSDNTIRFTRIS